ncbi:MAG: SDR family oxidoreductase [Polaromonas sp.]|uniref:SDR family NAD(P)-dependent oxidoreductase n=1 Tax=Polaromonas sp. TaxID=1869339 RepID=UPI002736AE79|nr:SDR family oxidoreductase [Polaromonas sp.]MDP3799556.1 SDR family oxidoreductase [Polaromonas sp.]
MNTSSKPTAVALVTGSGRNIGREIALGLAASGVAIAVNVRSSAAEGQAVVDEIIAMGGQALLCVADVTDQSAVAAMMAAIQATWGRLDILVNNAAIRREAKIDDISVRDWRDTLAVILDGAFFCAQAALPLLRASGRAAIINIGGMTSHTGAAERVHVVTAKAGLGGLTRALAHDLSPDGITVNCIAPGMVDTRRDTASSTTAPKHHARHHPLLGRRGTAAEIAASVVWLAGPSARFITGQTLHVNGGTYLGV